MPVDSPRQVSGAVLYTRGDEVYSPAAYRASFGYTIARALGGQAALDDYTLGRALGVSAVAYACTEYAANTISQLPIVVRDPSGEPIVGGTPFTHFISKAPRLLALSNRSLDIWGRTYLWKRPNPYGWKTGLEFINPQRIRELNTVHMRVAGYEIRDEWGYLLEANALPEDVIVIEAFDPEPTGVGLSKFEVSWLHLGIELGLAQHAAAFFTNAARIDGMLTFDRKLSPEEEKTAQQQWKEFKGAKNAHSTAVMPGGATWTSVQAVPKDLAMAELSADDIKKIVGIWGMHPALLGFGDAADPLSANSTYSALEINYIRNAVLPRAKNLILDDLNEQWAWTDFDRTDYYTLAVDEAAIPQLAEAQLAKSETSRGLTDAGMLDFDEGRRMLGYPERDEGAYLVRNPERPRVAWESGAITLAEYRQMVTGKGGDDPSAEVVMIAGQIVPAARLMDIAIANAERLLIPATGAGSINPNEEPPPPDAPALPALPDAVPDETRSGVSLCIALDLANQPDLVALQRNVQGKFADQKVTWNAPDTLHCTLLVLPNVPEDQVEALVQALWDVDVPEMDLRIGSLSSFDNVGEHALHFKIRRNGDLYDFQRALYELAVSMGYQPSGFSLPEKYDPHVTMGYCAVKPKAVTYLGKATVRTDTLIVWKEDDVVYHSADDNVADAQDAPQRSQPSRTQCMECSAPPTKDVKWAEGKARAWFCDTHFEAWSKQHLDDTDYVHDVEGGEVPENFSDGARRSNRSIQPLRVVIDLTDNQFVRYARRALSEALTTQGVLDAAWVSSVEWCIPLASVEAWTPNDVARYLRAADLSESRKLDLPTNGWHIDHGTIYLTLYPSDALDALRASVVLDLEGVDLTPSPEWIPAIAVARLENAERVQVAQLPVAQYPLVAANVTVARGDTVQQRWELRGVATAQLAELKRWQQMVRRKGPEYDFTAEHLPPLVDAFIRFSLAESASEDAVFEVARELLTRTYRDTRAGFTKAVATLLYKALSDDGTRRELSNTFRTLIRRFGLQAAADALADAGVASESLSKDDVALFRTWQTETSAYISGLGEEIFKEPGGLTEAGVSTRAEMWCNKSLDAIYYAILRANAPEKRGTWRVGPTETHCRNEGSTFGCQERNGETRTMDEWEQIGFPGSDKLTCGGFQCGCSIYDAETGKELRAR